MITCPVCTRECADGDEFCLRCRTRLGQEAVPTAHAGQPSPGERTVSGLLAAGIFFGPFVFGWLVFRRGHSTLARTLTVGWMLLIGAASAANVVAQKRARAQVVNACKGDLVDCGCFETHLGGLDLDENRVREAMRACFVPEKARRAFLARCLRDTSERECACIFDAQFGGLSREALFDALESIGASGVLDPAAQARAAACAGTDPVADPPAPGEPAPRPVSAAWAITSADGRASLAQVERQGGCRVRCELDGAERWSFDRSCDDNAADLHFVASDCRRWVVFYANPPAGSTMSTRYISVYDGTALGWHVVGAALVKELKNLGGTHLIRGLGREAGTAPRYAVDGRAVEFTTFEGVSEAVPLFAEPPAAPSRPRKRR